MGLSSQVFGWPYFAYRWKAISFHDSHPSDLDACDRLDKKKKKKLPSPLKKINYHAPFKKKPKYKKYNQACGSASSNARCQKKKNLFEKNKTRQDEIEGR